MPKIIQITATPATLSENRTLYALCDDWSTWALYEDAWEWSELPKLK